MREFVQRNHFLLRRLHSLTGVVPVGLFLVFHLFENSRAIQGVEAYNHVVESINSLPFVLLFEIFGIFLPLYFHAIYGIWIALDARHNVSNYSYGRNWAFLLQRVTGLITLVWVTYHIFHFRVPKALGAYNEGTAMPGLPDYFTVANAFADPIVATIYGIGIIAAAYHFANGLYTFLITWGITIGPRSQRVSSVVTNVLFVMVSAMGLTALFAFR
ncbi:succinate dehydrogenase / fumarate reductase cytochrome b subunit [Symbiobacterium terraclitae]|uniref:Succinate dehydrogenase / fumarate reductase cytochrome b subunit n=1 Tax=Symbiobacterium terraclitae TaxID=557451 RepID=A0ABS4JV36_9FIRM|nr:succinate dehydrogenase cytochrome b558 subunit [Symbiobacterium terraclitae]MBP2018319.1 succinate dehydrogenase / fumarate reductase cytochrome b subunit [Symbiobacterium terraclitae]